MTLPKLHLSHYHRYLWPEHGLLVVRGNLAEVLTCRQLYEERHGISAAKGAGAASLVRLMGAAGLAAVSLTQRESWGWSVTLAGQGFGLFCAVEPEGMLCCRMQQAPADRFAVVSQRQKAGGALVQSNIKPPSDDPRDVVQAYFTQVEQIATRVALGENDLDGVLVQALPDGDLSVVQGLDHAGIIGRVDQALDAGQLKHSEEVLLFYECRCDDEMILQMITSLPAAQRRELWGDEQELQVDCPRCGRRYTLTRGGQE